MKLNPTTLPLLDLLGKGSALVLLAFALQQTWRRASAAHRSLIWLAVFAALAMLPATLLVKPQWVVTLAAPVTAPPPDIATALLSGPVSGPPAMPSPAPSWWPAITLWQGGVALWVAGCLGVLGFRGLGGWQLRGLLRASAPGLEPRLTNHLDWLREEFGIKRCVEIRQSPKADVPLTWGWLKPVLLLPANATTWDDERLDAALRHELGHVRHFDACSRWLATLVCALWWPVPWVWMASKAWRLEQEKACDDLVLRAGAPAETYAMQLLQAARSMSPGSSAAMAMARPSTLETRLRAVMDEQRNRRPMSSLAWMVSGTAALALGGLCALTQLRAAEPADKETIVKISTEIIEAPTGTLKAVSSPSGNAVIADTEWKAMRLKLNQSPGVDILSAPTVTTRSGQRASVQVGTEVPVSADGRQTHFQGIAVTLDPLVKASALHLDVKVRVSEPDGTKDGARLFRDSEVAAGADLEDNKVLVVTGLKSSKPGHEVFCFITQQIVSPNPLPSPVKAKADNLILPTVTFAEATLDEALEFLRVKARDLDPGKKGINIVHIGSAPDARLTLDLRQVPLTEALRYVAELASLKLSFGPDAAVIQKAEEQTPEPASDSAALAKAKTLILPHVDFREASVDESVEYFRVKSVALDPDHQGINIIIKPGADTTAAKITMSLKEVPLAEALRYVAELANLKIGADASALVLSPK